MFCSLKRSKVSVVGLGYVGLPLAVELGKVREVIGFDINPARINELIMGFDRTHEIETSSLKAATLLKFSSNEKDLFDSDTFIVTVPTPIDNANKPDLKYLVEVSRLIAKFLKKGDLVIYESTVYPGVTEEVCVKYLEEESGLLFNEDFFCGYSPERINPGDKINTITKIKKITSGSNQSAADAVDNLYKEIITAGTWKASSIKIAEAAKVIENSQRDLNIAFVNELSIIFEKIGIDTLEVLEAAGSKWNFLPFRPGMVGGHCISVDPYYLTYKAEELGYHPEVILSGRRINDNMAVIAAQTYLKKLSSLGIKIHNARIGILGVTFKENCPDTRNSKVFDLIDELTQWGINIFACDSWALKETVNKDHSIDLVDFSDLEDLDGLIIAVGHEENRLIEIDAFNKLFRNPSKALIGDLKSLYTKAFFEDAGYHVFRL